MKTEITRCPKCGSVAAKAATRLGAFCPVCVLRAGRTPVSDSAEPLTTWVDVFPQLEVETPLRESQDFTAYRARVIGGGEASHAVLQIVSGDALRKVGGASVLQTRAQRLVATRIDGVAPVLDYGDLADAFFLVTAAPAQPTVVEALGGMSGDELSLVLDSITSDAEALLQAGKAARVPLRFESELCFIDEDTGRLLLTPPLLVGGAPAGEQRETNFLLVPGRRIGVFELQEQAGEGGFGEVWRARQDQPVERQVAVKILKQGLHSQRARVRFELEQQALAQLDHPHIARFFDGGTTSDGRPFFAMEWIDGQPITKFCSQSKASLDERLRLFREVCDAVQHAHQKGIIHRDLKSSNVMVTGNGNANPPSAKVIDFGIARALEDPLTDRTLLTRAEEILGTPACMSPEQAAGAGGIEFDARTDVYGLGVLLYELLTGNLPFDPMLPADELRRQIGEVDPPKPSSLANMPDLVRRLRGDLDWIVIRCLEKEPERRYASVSALSRDLERHLSNEPVEAGPPTVSYRTRKFVRRHRTGLAIAAALILLMVAATVISTAMFFREQSARHDADEARLATRVSLYSSHMYSARQSWEDKRIDRYRELLDRYIPSDGDPDLRGWEWYYLRSLTHRYKSSPRLHEGAGVATCWSPDGERVASGGESGEVVIYDPTTNQLVAKFSGHTKKVASISWDPLQPRLASADMSGTVFVWSLGDPDAVSPLISGGVSGEAHVAWSPDGRSLATGGADKQITIWDAKTLVPTSMWKVSNRVIGLDWSPSGGRLAVAQSGARTASVWEVPSGKLLLDVVDTDVPRRGQASVRWSPDGRFMAMCGWELSVFETTNWERHLFINPARHYINRQSLAWSPDSRLLAASHDDGAIHLWDVSAKKQAFSIFGSEKEFTAIDWQRDERDRSRLVAGTMAGTVMIWDGRRVEEASATHDFKHVIRRLRWDPSGTQLALTNFSHSFQVWDPEGDQVVQLGDRSKYYGIVDWNSLGEKVALITIDGLMEIWNPGTGKEVLEVRISRESEDVHPDISWSPDGKWIAVAHGLSASVWDAKNGQSRFEIPGEITVVSWSPDGRYLATGTRLGGVELWDPEGRLVRTILKDSPSEISVLQWSPDSQRLAIARPTGEAVIRDCGDSSSPLSSVNFHRVERVAWHPDGSRVAIGDPDGLIRIADSVTGEELMVIHAFDRVVMSLDWSPDGKRLASGAYDGKVKVWDASRGYELDEAASEPGPNLKAPSTNAISKGIPMSDDESLDQAKLALEAIPDHPYYLNRYGELLEHSGQLEQALEYYLQALEAGRELKDGGMREVGLENQAHVLSALGRYVEATDAYRSVLSLRFAGESPAGVAKAAAAARYGEALALIRDSAAELRSPKEKLQLAILLYLVGERADYETLCLEWKTGEDVGGESVIDELLASAWAMGVDPNVDWRRLSDVAARASALLKAGEGENAMEEFRFRFMDSSLMHGLAQYRAGENEDARKVSGLVQHQKVPSLSSAALAVQAMALHRLGKEKEARSTLRQIYIGLNPHDWRTVRSTLDERWHVWLIARILLAEAEQMISSAQREGGSDAE